MWETIQQYLTQPYFGNTLAQYVSAFVVIFIAMVLRFVFCSIVYHRLASWVGDQRSELDTQVLLKIKRPLSYVILFIGLSIALKFLIFSKDPVIAKKIDFFLAAFFSTIISLNVAFVGIRFVDIITIYMRNRADATESKLDDQLVPLISKSLKVFVFLIAFAVIVQNLGYSISGILAGLGIGGLALALAAKDTLSNLFGSVTIFMDYPFQVGDWVKVGDVEGTVESVGFRSTRIRTFYKTQISVPNNTIANATIDNFSRMQRRRISTTLGFTYETTAEKMEEALKEIREVLKTTEGVNQDFYLVNFKGFGPSSLDVMLYYFTDTTNWQEYLNIREKVNLNIMKAMAKIGVEFAFNSMSLYFRSDKPGKPPEVQISGL